MNHKIFFQTDFPFFSLTSYNLLPISLFISYSVCLPTSHPHFQLYVQLQFLSFFFFFYNISLFFLSYPFTLTFNCFPCLILPYLSSNGISLILSFFISLTLSISLFLLHCLCHPNALYNELLLSLTHIQSSCEKRRAGCGDPFGSPGVG